jgi:hypothetical protein
LLHLPVSQPRDACVGALHAPCTGHVVARHASLASLTWQRVAPDTAEHALVDDLFEQNARELGGDRGAAPGAA